MFGRIKPSADEIAMPLPGDNIIKEPAAVMNRAFSLSATPDQVWPWFVQLGKNRAGWYFPRRVERFIVPSKRGLRSINPELQNHKVGQRIDDWGGKHGYLEIVDINQPHFLLYKSTRGKLSMSWVITLWPEPKDRTRVIIRLRMTGIKHIWFLKFFGELFDALTIDGLASGLHERLEK